MSTDPTVYHPIEPTVPAFDPYAPPSAQSNPYEVTEPYHSGLPLVPPPPPKQRHTSLIILWLVTVLLGSAIGTGALLSLFSHTPLTRAPSPTPVHPTNNKLPAPSQIQPTPSPIHLTPTSILTASVAMQLYLVFEHHGLAKNDGVENDTEYQPDLTKNPSGGVVDFTDIQSNQPYTIVVFATYTEASQAATILYNGGDNTYSADGKCMLHIAFASHASDFATKQYISIMDTMCK